MCGIIGVTGTGPAVPRLIDSLKRLEYRGYDSAGVAALVDGRIERVIIATPGVGRGPKVRTSIPAEEKPATSAGSII